MLNFLSYYSKNHADSLNLDFQALLKSEFDMDDEADDIFLFYTRACYERERAYRSSTSRSLNGGLSVEDLERIDQEIRYEMARGSLNKGNLDLSKSQSGEDRETRQLAIDFLFRNAKKIDYITGLTGAAQSGYQVPFERDTVEFGVPLRKVLAST